MPLLLDTTQTKKIYLHFLSFFQIGGVAGTWNPILWKTRTYLTQNSQCHGWWWLKIQGALALAAMILIWWLGVQPYRWNKRAMAINQWTNEDSFMQYGITSLQWLQHLISHGLPQGLIHLPGIHDLQCRQDVTQGLLLASVALQREHNLGQRRSYCFVAGHVHVAHRHTRQVVWNHLRQAWKGHKQNLTELVVP